MSELTATCAITGQEFTISEGEQELLRQFDLPLPTTHPVERYLWMVAGATPFQFEKIVCPKTGKQILSRWPQQGCLTAVDPDWFWSDECDNTEAGREYDFDRPFFEQFEEVARRSYTPSINRINCENSPYVNASYNMKDSHLCFVCHDMQDSLYCMLSDTSQDLAFCIGCHGLELCYRCVDCIRCYGSRWLQDCRDCRDCAWCLDCVGCANCFGCVGLRQARDGYYIYNQKVSSAEWEEQVGKLDLGSYRVEQEMRENCEKFFIDQRDYETSFANEDCLDTNHTTNCRNCRSAWYSSNCQDCQDLIWSERSNDCYSSFWLTDSERCYQVAGSSNAHNCFLSDGVIEGSNHRYGLCSFNGSTDLLGGIFLKKKHYCILNKQYTKAEYEELLPRVIEHMKSTGEWGTYPPPRMYGGGYRESWSHVMMADLTDEQIEQRGFTNDLSDNRTIESGLSLPDRVRDFGSEMVNQEIKCAESSKPYSISARELVVLVKLQAPIPRLHWSIVLTKMMRLSIDLSGFLSQ